MFIIFQWGSGAVCKVLSRSSSKRSKSPIKNAKECLLAAVKADPQAASIWVNLANAYYMEQVTIVVTFQLLSGMATNFGRGYI